METAPEIVFEGMDPSPYVGSRVTKEVEKLEQMHGRITSCRVVIHAPHRHHHKGYLYHAALHLTMPGNIEVTVNRNPSEKHSHEDVYVAIRDSFRAARRQLQEKSRRQKGKIKVHETPPHGTVARLFEYEGYGFIASSDGREIYFHRNSVVNSGFEQLAVGAEVRFEEAVGEKGPQATTVKPIGKHHIG